MRLVGLSPAMRVCRVAGCFLPKLGGFFGGRLFSACLPKLEDHVGSRPPYKPCPTASASCAMTRSMPPRPLMHEGDLVALSNSYNGRYGIKSVLALPGCRRLLRPWPRTGLAERLLNPGWIKPDYGRCIKLILLSLCSPKRLPHHNGGMPDRTPPRA